MLFKMPLFFVFSGACVLGSLGCAIAPADLSTEETAQRDTALKECTSGDMRLSATSSCEVRYGADLSNVADVVIPKSGSYFGDFETMTLAVDLDDAWYSIILSQQPDDLWGSPRETTSMAFRLPNKAAAVQLDYTGAQYAGGRSLSTGCWSQGPIALHSAVGADVNSVWGTQIPFAVRCE